MGGVTITILVSAGLVVVEYFCLLFIKYRVCKKTIDNKARELMLSGVTAGKSREQLETADKEFYETNNRYLLYQVIPGPEVCFLALTVEATLILIFEDLDKSAIRIISPNFLSEKHALAQLFVMFVISLIAWIGTAFWRERIVEKLQQEKIILSLATIVFIAGLCLGFCVYIFIGGR
jgi:hypothetical protein